MESNDAALIFENTTAWFSRSVRDSLKLKWENHGGQAADVHTASFMFSENAFEDDTKGLYARNVDGCLAVFHPAYIDACLKAGDMRKVCVGHYYLPPAEMHEVIKEETSIRYAWEDWEKKYSKTRKRSSSTICRSSSVQPIAGGGQQDHCASKAAKLQRPARPRPAPGDDENREAPRFVSPAAVGSGRPRAFADHGPADGAATLRPDQSRRVAGKSMKSQGTQLDSTPLPVDASVWKRSLVSPSAALVTPSARERLPRIVQRLENTPLASATAAWHHFRARSTGAETPAAAAPPPGNAGQQTSALDTSGNPYFATLQGSLKNSYRRVL